MLTIVKCADVESVVKDLNKSSMFQLEAAKLPGWGPFTGHKANKGHKNSCQQMFHGHLCLYD